MFQGFFLDVKIDPIQNHACNGVSYSIIGQDLPLLLLLHDVKCPVTLSY